MTRYRPPDVAETDESHAQQRRRWMSHQLALQRADAGAAADIECATGTLSLDPTDVRNALPHSGVRPGDADDAPTARARARGPSWLATTSEILHTGPARF